MSNTGGQTVGYDASDRRHNCVDCIFFVFDPDVDEIGNRLTTGEVSCERRPEFDDDDRFPFRNTNCKQFAPAPPPLEAEDWTWFHDGGIP